MRIAQVITLFLPEFVGGATLVCARTARALAARGHDVSVFCGRPDGAATPYGERAWLVDDLPVVGANVASGYVQLDRRNYRHPEVTPVFERFLDRARPEVVHFHSLQALGVTLVEAAAARGLPIVLTMHDWWWFCVRLFLVDPAGFICPPRVDSARCHCAPEYDFVARRRDLERALALADRVLTPSRFLAAAAIANGVPAARVAVCPNGVEPLPQPARRRAGPVRFGYFGGPDNRLKGLPTLLAAAAALDLGGWELALHAVPPDAAAPPWIADRVRHRPAFAAADLAAVLARLDCLVVPSLMRESFSLVTREALAAGVPVIASDSGGPAEVLAAGVNGLAFATGDVCDLARQMRRLILEPDLLGRLRAGAAATPLVTVSEQAAQLERVYGEAGAAATGRRADPPKSRAPAPPSVLFIAGADGAPLRYRVLNLCDQLRARGVTCRVLFRTDPAIPVAIAAAALVVVFRVPMGPYLRACIAEARRHGRPLVFSCDDLVFDLDAIPEAALAHLPAQQRAWWRAACARYAEALAACDAFAGSTEPLVAAAERLGVPGFVARNGLGEAQLRVVEDLRKRRWGAGGADAAQRGTTGDTRGVVLVYASGTNTHDVDFASIEHALADVLARRPRVRLRIVGFLHPGGALAPFAERIEHLPFVPWPDLFSHLADADVNLAPLALPDRFADAKSEVKYLEAAALGVPTIAAPSTAFRHAIRDGDNGRLAPTADAWRARLLEMVDDAGLRQRLGRAALDDVFLRYTPAAQADALCGALATLADRVARRPAAAPALATVAARPADFPGDVGAWALEPEDAEPGTAQLAADTPSPFLLFGRSVGQTFVPRADGLYRVDVRVGTDGRACAGRLALHVTDRPGANAADVRTAAVDAADLPDEAWVAFEFAPLTPARPLYVWLELDGASPERALTLWTYARGWGDPVPGGLHLDHRPVAGSLTFRTFHRSGAAAAARPLSAAPAA